MATTKTKASRQELLMELDHLRSRLADQEEVLRAIRSGEVDAILAADPTGHGVITLDRAQSTYKVLVEAMNEGAALLKEGDLLVYCNGCLARMLKASPEHLLGVSLLQYVVPEDLEATRRLLEQGKTQPCSGEIKFRCDDGTVEPAQLSVSPMHDAGVPGICVVATDLAERIRVEEQLRSLSLVDELTGLFNRRGFLTLAEQELKLAQRLTGKWLLVFADMDGLKQINDELGHLEGDRALVGAAEVLRLCYRDCDIIARLGGDEFAVLALGTPDLEASILVNRLTQHLDAYNARDERRYQLSMSVGIVRHDPQDPQPVAELLRRADALMYEQKRLKQSSRLPAMPTGGLELQPVVSRCDDEG